MIRYNWDLIKQKTGNDINKILNYFKNCYVLKGTMYEFMLSNKWAVEIQSSKEYKGSFIVNIDDFIKNDLKATLNEQHVYLDLISRRDAFSYMNTKGKVIYLPIWKIEGIYDANTLKTNRLLIIDENNIYFVYEGEN